MSEPEAQKGTEHDIVDQLDDDERPTWTPVILNVEETIRRKLWCYPGIFPDRAAALEHLFGVIGNGYQWREGGLVNGYEWPDDEDALERYSKPPETHDHRGRPRSEGSIEIENKVNADSLAEVHAARADIDRLVSEPGQLTVDRLYPLSEYSHGVSVPPDVRPEWAAAIEEWKLARENAIEPPPPMVHPPISEETKRLLRRMWDEIRAEDEAGT